MTPAVPYSVYVKDASGKFTTPVPVADLLAAGNTITQFASLNNNMLLAYTDANGVAHNAEATIINFNGLEFDAVAKTLRSNVNGSESTPIDLSALYADVKVDSVNWDQGTFILTLTETSPDGGITPGTVHTIDLQSLIPVAAAGSIVGDGTDATPLQLANDLAAPGAYKVYGTDSTGTKGWQEVASGAIQIASETITAVVANDAPLDGFGDASKAMWGPFVWLKVLGADGLPLLSGGKQVLIPGYLAD